MEKFGAFPQRANSYSEELSEKLRELREFLADRHRDLADNELYEKEIRIEIEKCETETQRLRALKDAAKEQIDRDMLERKILEIQSEINEMNNTLRILSEEDQDNESATEEAQRILSETGDKLKKHLN